MKYIQHANKKDVFAEWLSANLCARTESKVYWPQICYDRGTAAPIHIIFEKTQHSFNWPWRSDIYLPYPYTNIDFTTVPPSLADGSEWDHERWYKDALQCRLLKAAERAPDSFWNWRLMTRPQGNLTCDLDVLYKKDCVWVGAEATEIWFVDENTDDISQDCYQQVCNLIHKRKAFNFKALRAQNIFMNAIGGEHFFVLHQIDRAIGQLVDDKVMVLPLDMDMIRVLETGTGSREQAKENFAHRFRFQSLNDFFGL